MFDIVLHEKQLDEGMTKTEAMDLIDMLYDGEFLPIEIDSSNGQSIAVGFIALEGAERLEYDYEASGLNTFIDNILADVDKESKNHVYNFKDTVRIWMCRDGEE